MLELRTQYGKLRILDARTASLVLSKNTNEKNQTFHFVNAYVLAEADKNLKYFEILSKGLCFCDSRILELYSNFAKSPVRQLRGFDFLKDFLPNPDMGSQLIIGGTQRNETELVRIVDDFFERHIDISFHQPKFSNDISELHASSILAIKREQPKTVWLGIGTPKQDYLANQLRPEFDGNVYCVGAAIAFLAGDVTESPKWIQRVGLEWLFRLGREPGRLWRRYLFGNFHFSWILIKDYATRVYSK